MIDWQTPFLDFLAAGSTCIPHLCPRALNKLSSSVVWKGPSLVVCSPTCRVPWTQPHISSRTTRPVGANAKSRGDPFCIILFINIETFNIYIYTQHTSIHIYVYTHAFPLGIKKNSFSFNFQKLAHNTIYNLSCIFSQMISKISRYFMGWRCVWAPSGSLASNFYT